MAELQACGPARAGGFLLSLTIVWAMPTMPYTVHVNRPDKQPLLLAHLPWVSIWAYGYAAGSAPTNTHELVGTPEQILHYLAAYAAYGKGQS